MYGDLFQHFPYVVIDGYFGCDALALGSVPPVTAGLPKNLMCLGSFVPFLTQLFYAYTLCDVWPLPTK